MHIALVLMQGNRSFSGGVPAVVLQRALKLRRDGHEVSVICRAAAGLAEYEERDGVHVYPVAPMARMIEAIFNRLSTASPIFLRRLGEGLTAAHCRAPIDLIDLQDGPAILGVRRFLRDYQVPVSFTIHGSARLNPAPRPWLGRLLHVFYERLAYRTAIAALPVSRFMAAAPEAFGFDPKKVFVLPNPVGRDFRDLPLKASRSSPLKVLFLARLVPEKGLETVLRALSMLPQNSFELNVVGDGPERAAHMKLCSALNLDPYVQWQGFVDDRAAVKAHVSESDIFVFPSTWEPQGIALLEAVAAGVTPIASDIPAVREVLPRSFCATPGDVSEWYEKLNYYLHNTEVLDRNQQFLRDIADRYVVDVVYENLSSTYDSIIKAHPTKVVLNVA